MEALPTLPLGLDGWCLRAWRTADAPSLARHANDERVWRNMSEGFPHPYTLEIARHWVERGHVDFGGTNWAIAFDDEAVGGCGMHPGEGRERCNCEIGYWLGEPFWGRGVVTDVERVLTAQALAHPGITRAFAAVHADNPASMRVLEKNSFHREGLLRQSAIKAGRPIDRVLWARLRAAPEPCVMSGMRAGAIGALVSMHAAYYGRYHDLGSVFEARVAQAMGEFVVRLDPARDGLWLLVDGERILGSIAIDAGSTAARACGGAQLRWFIVDPSLHSRGFGRRLLAAALDHCRAAARLARHVCRTRRRAYAVRARRFSLRARGGGADLGTQRARAALRMDACPMALLGLTGEKRALVCGRRGGQQTSERWRPLPQGMGSRGGRDGRRDARGL